MHQQLAPKYARDLFPSRPDRRRHDHHCKRHGGCPKCAARREHAHGVSGWIRLEKADRS